ncbi:MAG TPA: DUF58 domain-containing protein [Candidatus Cybelea sp.]|nr:DUF58 domain-containing protein [Candidatus Cybelea sp.]
MIYSEPLSPSAALARAHKLGRISFAWGPRFLVALLLGFVALGPAWWFRQAIAAMFLWDGIVLAVWLWDLLRLPRPEQLEVRRGWEKRPCLGASGSVVLEIRNGGKLSIRARLVDETPTSLRSQPPELSFVVKAGDSAEARYSVMPAERGDMRLGRTFIRYQSPLGLAERWAVAETQQTIRVLPNLEQARRQTLYLIRSRQVELEKRRRRQRGIGREFDSLREYREGDELRDISWTATARRHHLITRVFQMERSQNVWLVLDAGRLLRAQVRESGDARRFSKLDYAVNAALSLAQVALYCGDRVGLLAYGRRIQQNLQAGRGGHHLRAMIESLAQVRAEAFESDHGRAVRALLHAQKRRSLVVWITDFAETATIPEVIEYAMHLTPRHLVVFAAMGQPDLQTLAATIPAATADIYRHGAALEISERRDVLLRGLRQRGVLALELLPGLLASSLVTQYLDIKERSIL